MADEVVQPFTDLPMKDLIAGPLDAACDSQIDLANAMVKYVKLLAYGGGGDGKVQTLDMELERVVLNPDGGTGTQTITVKPPLLGLVPVPALLIDSVDIDFNMEVTNIAKSSDSKDTEMSVDAKASIGFGFWKASATMHGKTTTHRENTRETDKSAKYDVKVHAGQQQQTEGISRLMDLLSSTVQPIDAGGGK